MTTRAQIQDAITAWRDGQTFNAVHPLDGQTLGQAAILWDDDAVKDLARVIAATIDGREIPSVRLPWSNT